MKSSHGETRNQQFVSDGHGDLIMFGGHDADAGFLCTARRPAPKLPSVFIVQWIGRGFHKVRLRFIALCQHINAKNKSVLNLSRQFAAIFGAGTLSSTCSLTFRTVVVSASICFCCFASAVLSSAIVLCCSATFRCSFRNSLSNIAFTAS